MFIFLILLAVIIINPVVGVVLTIAIITFNYASLALLDYIQNRDTSIPVNSNVPVDFNDRGLFL